MDNITLLSKLYDAFGSLVVVMLLCSLRITITLIIIPIMSDQIVQGVHRMAISLLMGAFVAYGQPIVLQNLAVWTLASIALKEVLLGMILGFAASTVFWVAGNVGYLIDDLAGFNNVQVSNPMRSDTSTPISAMLSQLTITAFWALGGILFLLGALYQSFEWWPILDIKPEGMPMLEYFAITQTDTLMELTAKLAIPMMLILVMIDLAFGFIAKGADKLEVIGLSMPVKGAVTLLMLAIFISLFIEQVRSQLSLREIAEKIHSFQVEKPKK